MDEECSTHSCSWTHVPHLLGTRPLAWLLVPGVLCFARMTSSPCVILAASPKGHCSGDRVTPSGHKRSCGLEGDFGFLSPGCWGCAQGSWPLPPVLLLLTRGLPALPGSSTLNQLVPAGCQWMANSPSPARPTISRKYFQTLCASQGSAHDSWRLAVGRPSRWH